MPGRHGDHRRAAEKAGLGEIDGLVAHAVRQGLAPADERLGPAKTRLGEIPDPLAPENLLKQSGRGIFLMRSLMDEVQIKASATGTEVKLIKHFPGNAADSQEASQ